MPSARRAWCVFRAGQILHRRAGAPSCLPPLLFFTDPQRVRDPVCIAAGLPRGSGLVYRSFGATDALPLARKLARICRRRGLILLIGADSQLVRRSKADGLHMPERLMRNNAAPGQSLLTAAAHGPRALQRARRLGAAAAVLSPVFASRSPSANTPLGQRRAAALARSAGLPVYALGGIGLGRLPIGPFCGLAVVEALLSPADQPIKT